MMRLWVQLSLRISALLIVVIIATVGLIFAFDGDHRPFAAVPGQAPLVAGFPLRFITAVAVVGVISVAVGIMVSWTVSAPITQLATAAHHIGTGNLRTRVNIGGSQELQELAHAFNTMARDLERAEELRANLMADVSHELRTPLTALEGNLRAALDRVYTLDEAEIANLYSQTRHLIRLVNDLQVLALADAHQLPLDKHPTDLAALVDETLQVFAPLAEEQGVRLEQQLEQLGTIDVDASRIRQVLHNLLANALRYTPRCGMVTVIGRLERDLVYVAVRDTGAGLGADQLEWVFERFYRSDKSRSRDTGGSGLGLAIVKAIVEEHGGRVTAQSNGAGRGSMFALELPRHRQD